MDNRLEEIMSINSEMARIEKRLVYNSKLFSKWKKLWVENYNAGNRFNALEALNKVIDCRQKIVYYTEAKAELEQRLTILNSRKR